FGRFHSPRSNRVPAAPGLQPESHSAGVHDRAVGCASDDARVWVRVPDHAAGAARAPGGFAAPADDAPLADRAAVVLPADCQPGGGAGPQAGERGGDTAANRVNVE